MGALTRSGASGAARRHGAGGVEPAQAAVQPAGALQRLDPGQPLVARPHEHLARQTVLAIGVPELAGAAPRVPLRTPAGELALQLPEVDAIVPQIGSGAFRDL